MASNNPNLRFIASQLRRLPLFSQVTDEQLEHVATIAQLARAQPGTLLAQQGRPSQGLFLFVSGRGMLTRLLPNGTEETVAQVNEGQYVGQESLYSERIEPYSLRAVESSVVLMVPKHALAGVISASPELRANIGMQPVETRGAVQMFKGQRPNETVLHVFKRHWWAFARQIWLPLLIASIFIIIAVLVLPSSPALALVLIGAAVLIPGGLAGLLYADWQDDCLIITDQRIVKIHDVMVTFQKSVNEIPFQRAHEVNTEIPPGDPFARLFGYGTLVIRTAGAAGTIAIDTLPNPQNIQSVIFAERDRFQQGAEERSRDAIAREIDQALGVPSASIGTPAPARRTDANPPPDAGPSLNPLRTRFINGEGATVYRRHISIWLRMVSPPLFIVFAGLILAVAVPLFPALRGFELIAWVIAGLLIVGGGIGAYLADWDWRHDMLVVGRDTITLIHKRPLWLQNEREQLRLSQVDNVISEVSGVINTMLNRGTIRVSLIGGDIQDAKVFSGVADPQQVQAEISERLAELRSQREQGDVQRQRQQIAEYLAAYHERVAAQNVPYTPNTPNAAPPPPSPQNAPSTYDTAPTNPDVPPPPVRDGSRPPNVPRVRGDTPPR